MKIDYAKMDIVMSYLMAKDLKHEVEEMMPEVLAGLIKIQAGSEEERQAFCEDFTKAKLNDLRMAAKLQKEIGTPDYREFIDEIKCHLASRVCK